MPKLRVGVIYGGESAEREVSLHTAEQIRKFLDKNKYHVLPIEISKTGKWPAKVALKNLRQQIDLAFIAMHGSYGEDGTIQGLLEMLHVPYTFSGVLASSLAMDKLRTAQLVAANGVLTPRTLKATKAEWDRGSRKILPQIKKLSTTVVLKPNASGSSIGVQIVDRNNLTSQLITKAFRKDRELLFQEYIVGKELTAPVLGNDQPQALPLIEIVPTLPEGQFYDYQAKYAAGGSEHIIPAPVSKRLYKQIQDTAVRAHAILGCRGVSRSDFIVTKDNKAYFLELNTIPGMTSTSLLPQSADVAGIPFPKLLDRIIKLAQE